MHCGFVPLSDEQVEPAGEPAPFELTLLGRAVASARGAARLTIRDLAARSGVEPSVLRDIEQARVDCDLKDLHAIAHALGIRFSQLIASGETGSAGGSGRA
ncbi:helix-turn-helix domain-containing protein [Winogradskya consettensis]|uniref:helix-turn-helix domain-containing protein n=1 Tax=Winogradskya consettensis TaxID=113560 RepID=UPI0034DABE4F